MSPTLGSDAFFPPSSLELLIFPGWQQLLSEDATQPLQEVAGRRQGQKGPGNAEGRVPVLMVGLNREVLAVQLGLPSLGRQQHPKRVPRPQGRHLILQPPKKG